MKKQLRAFHYKDKTLTFAILMFGFILCCVGYGVYHGILNVLNHWDYTDPNACNYLDTHIVSTNLCVLGKFFGAGILAGFAGFFSVFVPTLFGGFAILILLSIPVAFYYYFFPTEVEKDHTNFLLAIGIFYSFIVYLVISGFVYGDIFMPFNFIFSFF